MAGEVANQVYLGTTKIMDISDTTAVASDVAQGKRFYLASGQSATGTASGGGVTVEETPDIGGGTIIEITASTGTTLIRGVLRPDAELVQTYTYDEYLHEDEGITIPSYTTTSTVLISSVSLTPTITCDFTTYDYYILVSMATIPEYSISTTGVGREEYGVNTSLYEVVYTPANSIHALVDPTKYVPSVAPVIYQVGNIQRTVYYSSASVLSCANSIYGYRQIPTTHSLSSNTLTLKSPAFSVQGSPTYLAETFMNAVTDVRYQYVIDVYRAPKGNLNLDGWGLTQEWLKANEDILGGTHTLT